MMIGMLISCGNDSKESEIPTEEILFKKEGNLYLIKAADTIQEIEIEIADTPYERETGLMYRKSMESDQGMLFIYPNEALRSFYMKNTYIPLDIIFYGKDSTVVSIQKNAQPLNEASLTSSVPAQYILELNAGKVDEWNIALGDRIDFSADN